LKLVRLRLLHLHDQIRLIEDRCGIWQHCRALPHVVGISDAGTLARAGLYEDSLASIDKLARPGWGQADAVLISLDFRQNADLA
jgi:hypothetical protein